MKRYNYSIKVKPVGSCPMNESDWEAAAARTGCNDTRGYHCVPDKFHESLIEFCYIKPRILVEYGNCLELAANGILNHVKCQNFTSGCPDKPYFSNEIYRYPVCLNIKSGCFTSDIICLRKMVEDLQTQIKQLTSKSSQTDCELLKILLIVPFVLLIFSLMTLTAVVCYFKRKIGEKKKKADAYECYNWSCIPS